MKIISAKFIKSATNPSQYPDLGVPEFAFYGRSNTGKSTLINMLVNKQGLVKTGSRPGMTQLINFFMVNDAFCLTDLPGFGYAEVPEAVRKGFKPMLEEYCNSRETLKTVFFLMDLRREPGDTDAQMLEVIQSRQVPIALVGTKADKLSKNQVNQAIFKWSKAFDIEPSDIFVTSSLKLQGRKELLALIQEQTLSSE